MASADHYSVLLEESVQALVTDVDGIYIDGTFGRGGHTRRILAELTPAGRVMAFDKDPSAVAVAKQLAEADGRLQIEHASFADLERVAEREGLAGRVSGVLLDLGVSSPQLDNPDRGFSFMQDGPLDMRMDPTRGISAADWVNGAAEAEIVRVLRDYGEERFAKRIAAAIVTERQSAPITRTARLAEIVKAANPKWERDKHPATRAFQAIRIEVNRELDDLATVLASALSILKPGGRLVVISFHSLEDRLVKRFFKDKAQGPRYPKEVWVTQDMVRPDLVIVGKSVRAGENELQQNIRSRSAIMRVAEKLAAVR